MPGIRIDVDASRGINSLSDFRKALNDTGIAAKTSDKELGVIADRFRDKLQADRAEAALGSLRKQIEQVGRAAGLSEREMTALHTRMGTMQTGASQAGGAIASISSSAAAAGVSMGALAGAALGVVTAYMTLKSAAELVADSIKNAARYETLGVVIQQVGVNAGYTKAEMLGFAEGIQQAGISMNASREALAKMATAQLDLTKSSQLARVAQDAAVISGKNSSEAFERIVQGITNGQTVLLRHQGIMVDLEDAYKKYARQLGVTKEQLTPAQERQAALNAVLETGATRAGVYEAAMMTAGKQITSFQRYIEDFKTTLGSAFLDSFTETVFNATGAMKELQSAIAQPEAQQAISSLAAGISSMINWIISNVPAAIRVFSQLVNVINTAKNMLSDYRNSLPELFGIFGDGAVKIIDLFGTTGPEKVAKMTSSLEAAKQEFAGMADSAEKVKLGDAIQRQTAALETYKNSARNAHSLSNQILPSKEQAKESSDALSQQNKELREYKDAVSAVVNLGSDQKNARFLPIAQQVTEENARYSKQLEDIQSKWKLAYDNGKWDDVLAINRSATVAAGQHADALEKLDNKANKGRKSAEAAANAAARYGETASAFYDQISNSLDQMQDSLTGGSEKNALRVDKWFEQQFDAIRKAVVGAKGDVSRYAEAWILLHNAWGGDKMLAVLKDTGEELKKQASLLKDIASATGDPTMMAKALTADAKAWYTEKQQQIEAAYKDEKEKAEMMSALQDAYNAKLISGRSEAYKSMSGVSSEYWEAERQRIESNLAVVKANADDELAYKVYAAQQWDEFYKAQLEQQAATAGSFGDTLAAKWSLAFGGYKSEMTKSKESWDQMSDSIIQATDGMIDGVAGGFGDLIRNIGNGTTSIEDLWQNMLSRMLDAFASFIEDLVAQQLKKLVGSMLTDSVSGMFSSGSTQGGAGAVSGGISSLKTIGKYIGSSAADSLASDASSSAGFIGQIAKANTAGITDAASSGTGIFSSVKDAALAAGGAAKAATATTSVLGTVGSALGVVGAIGGLVGLAVSLFGEKKEEIKKTASGYNVGYAGGHATSYGVDFYSDGSVTPTGASDPAVQKKISDSFRTTAESLSDFAEELGFAVDVLEGFQMPNMNVTGDQLDTYIASGNNMMAFKGLMESGMRGAFDAVARDGEVYSDEYERLATSLSSVQGKFEAYGYKLSDVAQITDEQISALSAKNIEVAQGTSQAMLSMASSMGATSDQLALIASNGNDGAAALAVTNEQLSTILEADYASQLLEAVGGEDAFAAIMGNLQKNVFATVESYAKNLDYYNERAQTAISKIGDATVTVDNFWVKFDEAIKAGLTVDEFEAWGKASSWVNNIDSVHQAMTDWDQSMTKVAQSLDQRMTAAQGWDYQAKLAKQMADAEWELAAAREAGYDAALVARLQEVQAAELAATIAQHQTDYQKAMLDAQERIASAADDKEAQLALQQTRNQMELQELTKTFNWSPGSADEPLFKAIQQAQTLELTNTIRAMQESLEQATESLTRDMSVREARLSGDEDIAEAMSMLAGQQDELTQAMKDGVSDDVIARLVALQSAEFEAYLASIDSTIKAVETSLSTIMETLVSDMASVIDKSIEAYSTLSTEASSLASRYYNAADSMYTQLRNWAIDDSGGNPELTFGQNKALFDSIYKKAMTGDADALENLSSVGSSLRNAAQGYYGSKDDYMAFYRDLQSKMGSAALVSDTLGDQKTDMAKLYDVQVNLYELLKAELSKDDPNTALLEQIGLTMVGVQSGIDTGTGYQKTLQDITEKEGGGSGGFSVIKEAVGLSEKNTSALLAQVAGSQSELADLLASYMQADRKETLLRKVSLLDAQVQNSKNAEVDLFNSSKIAEYARGISTYYFNRDYANYDVEGSAIDVALSPFQTHKWEGTWLDQWMQGRPGADPYTVASFFQGNGAYTGAINMSEMYEYLKTYLKSGNSSWRGWDDISDIIGYVLPSSLSTQINTTASLESELGIAQKMYDDYVALTTKKTSSNSISALGVSDVVTTDDSMSQLVALVQELRDEVKNLRAETESANVEIVVAAKKTASTLAKFDIDGMPTERTL